MIRKKYYCYRSYSGNFLETLKRDLTANVFDKVYSLYLIHSVEDMLKFEDFEFFRACYQGIRVTFQQYVSGEWCCKIEY